MILFKPCSIPRYAIMRACWEDEPCERPTFCQLRLLLEDLLTEDRDYLVLEDIDVPLTNSDNSSSPLPEDMIGSTLLCQHRSHPHPQLNVTPPITNYSPGSLVSEESPSSLGLTAAGSMAMRSFPSQSSTSSAPCLSPSKTVSPRRDHLRINVCVHQKSTERLIRPSESDSSPSSCWTISTDQKYTNFALAQFYCLASTRCWTKHFQTQIHVFMHNRVLDTVFNTWKKCLQIYAFFNCKKNKFTGLQTCFKDIMTSI